MRAEEYEQGITKERKNGICLRTGSGGAFWSRRRRVRRRGLVSAMRRFAQGKQAQPRDRRKHAEGRKRRTPAHQIGQNASKTCRKALSGEGDPHEDADRSRSRTRTHHVSYKRLRDRNDSRRKTARDDTGGNQKLEARHHRAQKGAPTTTEHDDAEQAQAADAIP